MKKIIKINFVLLLIVTIVSCETQDHPSKSNLHKDAKKTNSLNSYYHPDLGLRNKLTSFSYAFDIFELDVKKTNINSYAINISRENSDNIIEKEDFFLDIEEDNLIVSFIGKDNNKYSIRKDLKGDVSYFIVEGNESIIDEKLINNIDSKSDYHLKRITSVFIELYDFNVERSVRGGEDCYRYVSAFGFTKAAAEERVNDEKDSYLKHGSNAKDCKTLNNGKPDTSCYLGAHICFSSISFNCKDGSTACLS